ncbi:U3 small nucleolar RNA-associated protein 4 homolog [Chironomus tepperi]|uniref:U3 small nucleolar RNA-associated protein 4 homolog n=1 Tax=Chironomus tepperi TaxID=113505 RepID=UPI00391F0A0D
MHLKEMSNEVKLHGIKCYNIQARGIKHFSYCHELKKLAVLRNDFSIEIWNFIGAPFIERVITGNINCALEQVCWVADRLFAISVSGDGIIEYDLKTLSKKRNLLLTGDKGICIDYHKKTERIAIGTEEGFINVFDVSDDDLQYVKVLDRQDHRIVCCKFNEAGDCIVSGSIDAVKIWSLKTGHVIHKMSTGRAEQHQETIVWCVEVLKDFTIITGDSRGRITFWDGNLGTQVDWIQASNFDIMSLTTSEDENAFYCSGIEQIVRKYVKIKTTKDNTDIDQWIRTAKRYKLHTHDILTLVRIDSEQIVSGGVDGFLSISTGDLKIIDKIGPFLKRPFAMTAEEARMMLMIYPNYLELWKLATPNDNIAEEKTESTEVEDEDNELDSFKSYSNGHKSNFYKISKYPEKYLELRSKQDEMVVCAAISNNGKWISYSTATSVRLFHFDIIQGSKPDLKRVKNIPSELTNCTSMTFSHDSNTLITLNGNSCMLFDISSGLIEHHQTISLGEYHKDLIHLLAVSSCSKYLAFASLCNNVSIWNMKKGKYAYSNNLPKYTCPPTSIKIRVNHPSLVISYADNRIFEYDLEEFYIQFGMNLAESRFVIQDICLDPRNSNTIIFSCNNSIMVIKKTNELDEQKSSKRSKKSNENRDHAYTMKVAKKLDTHLIHLNWMSDDELLALEMNPVSLTENLPAPLRRKIFGAM